MSLQPDSSPNTEVLSCSRPELNFGYEHRAYAQTEEDTQPSICAQMRRDISQEPQVDFAAFIFEDTDFDIPVVESLSPLMISSATPPPVVGTPLRLVTPNNRSLTYLQSGPFDQPQCYLPLTRGAVSNVSLASSDLLAYVEPLPLDQLMFHSTDTVRSWPVAARDEVLAVAHRDMAVARRNLAELTQYLDNQSTHLAACTRVMDDSIPLMSAETFPRMLGGIRSALAETQQRQL